MECIKCVFPSPTPPYRNSGLYTSPGDSATATDAACAKLLLLPTTNVSKVYFGLSPAFSAADFVFFFSAGFEDERQESFRRCKFQRVTPDGGEKLDAYAHIAVYTFIKLRIEAGNV